MIHNNTLLLLFKMEQHGARRRQIIDEPDQAYDKFIHFYGNHKEILNIHGLSSDKIFKKVIEK